MTGLHEAPPPRPVDLRVDIPHSARIYDYLLGGKTNYAPDREAGDATARAWPELPVSMRQNRLFMLRAARYLTAELGLLQFLDIGTGIPTQPNLHEVAQGEAPDARVVYVDNDPIVLAHAQALMRGTPQGRTAYVQADLRAPETILDAPELHDTLDLSRPVALFLIAIVHFLPEEADPLRILRRLLDPLPPGSALALTTSTADADPEGVTAAAREYAARGIPMVLRDRAATERLFDGLALVEPGITLVHRWRPDLDPRPKQVADREVCMYGGVALKR